MASFKLDLSVSKIIDEVKRGLYGIYEPYKRGIDTFVDGELIDCIVNDGLFNEKYLDRFKNKDMKFHVAGGALTSSFCKTDINDFDIYFEDEETFNIFYEIMKESYASVIAETPRAVSLNRSGQPFQLIKLFGTVEETFDKFDFTINMCALNYTYNYEKNELKSEFVMDNRFMSDLASRSLIFNPKTLYPINSLFRVKKYKERGFKINTYEMMKIALRISQIEIKTIGDIKNQCIGLSSAIAVDLTEKLDWFEDNVVVGDPIKFIQDLMDEKIVVSNIKLNLDTHKIGQEAFDNVMNKILEENIDK